MPKPVRVSKDGIFYTLQGEGPLVGVPSIFIRLDTCNLRCKWGDVVCDAHYTSWTPGDQRIDLDDLLMWISSEMQSRNCKHIVLNGGEPMLQAEVVQEICRAVSFANGHVTIETNGTVIVDSVADLICLSPKLKSSTPVGSKYEGMHTANRWNPNAIRFYMREHNYYFKFVIDCHDDVTEVEELLAEVGQRVDDPEHVLFMPQGIGQFELQEKGTWLASICKDLGVRFTPRLQIALWGNKPGT